MTTTDQTKHTVQDIIEAKIEFLNGNSNTDLNESMLSQIEANPALKTEIEFIESIWKKPELDNSRSPSPQMQARFYQMLSQAQTAQTESFEQVAVNEEARANGWSFSGVLQKLGWFQPAFQFAMVLSVFTVGWLMAPANQAPVNTNTAALEKQVDTLNVMVALSMLKNDSASERLAGIDYSRNVGLNNQQVTSTLISLLNSDRSSAVRLSAVESLAKSDDLTGMRKKLVESLSRQTNVIVQLALVDTLHQASPLTEKEIELILSNSELDSEVVKLIQRQYQEKSTPVLSA